MFFILPLFQDYVEHSHIVLAKNEDEDEDGDGGVSGDERNEHAGGVMSHAKQAASNGTTHLSQSKGGDEQENTTGADSAGDGVEKIQETEPGRTDGDVDEVCHVKKEVTNEEDDTQVEKGSSSK